MSARDATRGDSDDGSTLLPLAITHDPPPSDNPSAAMMTAGPVRSEPGAVDPCANGHVGPFAKKPTDWPQFDGGQCVLHQCDPHLRNDIVIGGPGSGRCWKCKARLACPDCGSDDLKDGGRKCCNCGRRFDG